MPTVRVGGIPPFIDASRLLGAGAWDIARGASGVQAAEATLSVPEAADLSARLRGVGFDGSPLELTVSPPLPRAAVRAARTADARRRRETTPGWSRREARLDDEGRYSLTPEPIAQAIAALASARSIIDATAGCGGNTIAFARGGAEVVAIERDPARALLLRHNLRVYGVERRVRVLVGDALELVPQQRAELLFVDPPWGEAWDRGSTSLADLPLLAALTALAPATGARELWAKVPPSFATKSLEGARARAFFGSSAGDERRVKLLLLRSRLSE